LAVTAAAKMALLSPREREVLDGLVERLPNKSIAYDLRISPALQRSIIRWAASAEQAVEAAKEQFAKLEGIRDWKIHAALIEVEPVADHR